MHSPLTVPSPLNHLLDEIDNAVSLNAASTIRGQANCIKKLDMIITTFSVTTNNDKIEITNIISRLSSLARSKSVPPRVRAKAIVSLTTLTITAEVLQRQRSLFEAIVTLLLQLASSGADTTLVTDAAVHSLQELEIRYPGLVSHPKQRDHLSAVVSTSPTSSRARLAATCLAQRSKSLVLVPDDVGSKEVMKKSHMKTKDADNNYSLSPGIGCGTDVSATTTTTNDLLPSDLLPLCEFVCNYITSSSSSCLSFCASYEWIQLLLPFCDSQNNSNFVVLVKYIIPALRKFPCFSFLFDEQDTDTALYPQHVCIRILILAFHSALARVGETTGFCFLDIHSDLLTKFRFSSSTCRVALFSALNAFRVSVLSKTQTSFVQNHLWEDLIPMSLIDQNTELTCLLRARLFAAVSECTITTERQKVILKYLAQRCVYPSVKCEEMKEIFIETVARMVKVCIDNNNRNNCDDVVTPLLVMLLLRFGTSFLEDYVIPILRRKHTLLTTRIILELLENLVTPVGELRARCPTSSSVSSACSASVVKNKTLSMSRSFSNSSFASGSLTGSPVATTTTTLTRTTSSFANSTTQQALRGSSYKIKGRESVTTATPTNNNNTNNNVIIGRCLSDFSQLFDECDFSCENVETDSEAKMWLLIQDYCERI
eukprot:PhM_4_TR18095/c0_g1_i1/m.49158